MTTIKWIVLPGLGRTGSSTLQWYLSSNPSTAHWFIGDTKAASPLGLVADSIFHYAELFPTRNSSNSFNQEKALNIADQIITHLSLKANIATPRDQDIKIYFCDERITDSINCDVNTNLSNLSLLFSTVSGRLSCEYTVNYNIVIRDELPLLKSYLKHNSFLFTSQSMVNSFLNDLSNGEDSPDFAYFYWHTLHTLLTTYTSEDCIKYVDFSLLKNDIKKFLFILSDGASFSSELLSRPLSRRIINSQSTYLPWWRLQLSKSKSFLHSLLPNLLGAKYNLNNDSSLNSKVLEVSRKMNLSNVPIWARIITDHTI